MILHIPPQAVEEERGVIGHCMRYKDAFEKAAQILSPLSFYHDKHRLIWIAMTRASSKRLFPDAITTYREMETSKTADCVGTIIDLSEDFKPCPQKNFQKFCQKIKEKEINRGRIAIAEAMIRSAYEGIDDPFDAVSRDVKMLKDLEPTVSDLVEASDLVIPIIDDMEAAARGESNSMYMGFKTFDDDYAVESSEIVVVGAGSGTGKTALMIRIMKAMRKRYPNMPWVFNSLDMKNKIVVARDLASSAGISQLRMRTGKGIGPQHSATMAPMIPDYKGIYLVRCRTHAELEVKIKQVKKLFGINEEDPIGVASDYVQLMHGKGGNREQQMTDVATTGQAMAIDNNALYFMLSQINRSSGTGRPTLGSLRETGAFEFVADWVMLGYNPSRNGEKTYEDGSSTDGIVEWQFAKVRFGKPDDVKKLMMSNSGLVMDMPGAGYGDEKSANGGESSQLDFPEIKNKDITIPNSERMREAEEKKEFPF